MLYLDGEYEFVLYLEGCWFEPSLSGSVAMSLGKTLLPACLLVVFCSLASVSVPQVSCGYIETRRRWFV